ncbi:hypothetical protein KR52_08630 [Synechococcus sp. KORDI-52]|nr:hypothetical protein KR52_08630 [Synechococcus sp. KORDI-52]
MGLFNDVVQLITFLITSAGLKDARTIQLN